MHTLQAPQEALCPNYGNVILSWSVTQAAFPGWFPLSWSNQHMFCHSSLAVLLPVTDPLLSRGLVCQWAPTPTWKGRAELQESLGRTEAICAGSDIKGNIAGPSCSLGFCSSVHFYSFEEIIPKNLRWKMSVRRHSLPEVTHLCPVQAAQI